jgi:DNA modification methylase
LQRAHADADDGTGLPEPGAVLPGFLNASGKCLAIFESGHAASALLKIASTFFDSTKRAARLPHPDLAQWLPACLRKAEIDQTVIPRIAKDAALAREIEAVLPAIPTHHDLWCHDARELNFIPDNTVHLVLTSPPYWTLKTYNPSPGQLGDIVGYDDFLAELDRVWRHCFRILVPGGRLVCVVGDVCLSRRKNAGEHTVVPLHASIQEHCRAIGYTNLAPIIWNKIANAVYEAEGNGGGLLGKPYEPNAIIKNDIEFILMERKPGGYRSPSLAARLLSVISAENHRAWFQQIWTGLTGASTRQHPAPFPLELAERLIRMFSFVGDTVLDPFLGTGTTTVAAARWGRNSIGVEVDPDYFNLACQRIADDTPRLLTHREIRIHK